MPDAPRYCWDNSLFVAWFNNQPPSDSPGMRAVFDEIHSGEALLIVPVIVYTEFMEQYNASVMDKFRKFLKRKNIVVVNISLNLAMKAEAIRTRGAREKPARKIHTPDALYLACAMTHKADMFQTTDRKMLQLNGSPTVEGLLISHPRTVSGGQSLF